MSKQCSICIHPNKLEIERQLASNVSIAKIQQTYDVSYWSLRAHKAEHLPKTLIKASEAKELFTSEALLKDIMEMRDNVRSILKQAEKKEWLNTQLNALKEWRSQIEFLTKTALELKEMAQRDQAKDDRFHIDRLKERLSKEEIRLLFELMSKLEGKHYSDYTLEAEVGVKTNSNGVPSPNPTPIIKRHSHNHIHTDKPTYGDDSDRSDTTLTKGMDSNEDPLKREIDPNARRPLGEVAGCLPLRHRRRKFTSPFPGEATNIKWRTH